MDAIDLPRIRAAAALLDGVAIDTPLEPCRWLSQQVGAQVSLKHEQLQRTGSFKIRGAYVRMSALTPSERARPVVAASAGNHAQGVALAAQLLGLDAVIFMPHQAPIPKEKATSAYGAQVHFAGHTVDEALLAAVEYSKSHQATLIHPFDHPDVVTGQATLGLELMRADPIPDVVLVPCGGGGLAAGIALATAAVARQRGRPAPRVVGVQAAGAAAYAASLDAGFPLAAASMTTMADGIAVAKPGAVPFAALQAGTTSGQVEWCSVSEEWISRAVLKLLERSKAVVEPAGAAAVAALMQDPELARGHTVAVLSGGNIDPLTLMNLIRHGLVAAGRYLELEVTIPDRPGGLAQLLTELAALNANVLEINHQRSAPGLNVGEVAVNLVLETRGSAHAAQVTKRLRQVGYVPTGST